VDRPQRRHREGGVVGDVEADSLAIKADHDLNPKTGISAAHNHAQQRDGFQSN
jgi:hypothetical protein